MNIHQEKRMLVLGSKNFVIEKKIYIGINFYLRKNFNHKPLSEYLTNN